MRIRPTSFTIGSGTSFLLRCSLQTLNLFSTINANSRSELSMRKPYCCHKTKWWPTSGDLLGADYMANFRKPRGNLSPANRAEISPRLPEQIVLKRRLPLYRETFSPVCETGLEISTRAEIQKNHVIALKFQPGLKSKLGHAQ